MFEYDAFIYPVEDLPLQRARMARRRRGKPQARRVDPQFLRENARLRNYVLRRSSATAAALA